MHGRRRAIIGATFALLAAGCGADEDEAGRGEFVARGNEICRMLDHSFDELGSPPAQGTQAAAVWELRVQQLGQRAFARLEALEPPDELAPERDSLVAAIAANRRHIQRLRVLADANAREIDSGISDGPAQRAYLDLSAEVERDSARVRRRFDAIGWTDCAKLSR